MQDGKFMSHRLWLLLAVAVAVALAGLAVYCYASGASDASVHRDAVLVWMGACA